MAWLKEFSVVMQRRYAYPPKHPSRVAAEEVAYTALGHALEKFPEISIAVSRQQLAIGGAFSDAKNPALCELSERFHRQGIGAITIRAGMSREEFDALLTRIVEAKSSAEDDDDIGEPEKSLGLHVAVEMLKYEGLALSDEEDEAAAKAADVTSDRLWRELAQAALTGWDGEDGDGSGGGGSANVSSGATSVLDHATHDEAGDGAGAAAAGDAAGATGPEQGGASVRRAPTPPRASVQLSDAESAGKIAARINRRAGDREFASKVLSSIIKVGRQSRKRGRTGSGAVAARLRDVLKALDPGTLKSLLDSEPNPERKRLLFLQGVDALPVSCVLDWIEAAAASSGKSISPYLLRLMKKLSGQARRRRDGGPDEGGESLREASRALIDGWTLETNETEAHSTLLEQIANHDKGDKGYDVAASAGAERLVQMALETDSFGSDISAAVDWLIDHRELTKTFGFLDEFPESKTTVPATLEFLESPETLRRVLLTEPIEAEGATTLLARVGPERVEPLLDALAISESQSTRHLILHRLRELGESAREPIMSRLDGSPWYVQRNLLALLGAMPTVPPDLKLDAYARHEEPTIRVEALKLLARIPAKREEAIHNALTDLDMRVVFAAMDAASGALPRRSALRVLQILQKSEDASEMRVRGIALLNGVPLAAARDWLLPMVLRTRGMLFWRRQVLAEKSPEMLAALRVLASEWKKDPKAATALRLAAQSDDDAVRDAVGAGRNA